MTEGSKGGARQSSSGGPSTEKRKNPRFRVQFPLGYSLTDGKTTHTAGLTADASEGGLLVYLPEKIPVGAILRIEILYTKDLSLDAIAATAKAVWTDLVSNQSSKEHRYGLQFQVIDEGNLNKLKALLKEVARDHP